MRGKDKYRRIKISEFLRYTGNKMSDKERNNFEKELQRDPFSEEAVDGFASIDADKAEEDLFILARKLDSRAHKRRGLMYYRIAASVAVLMIISSVYIVLDRNKPLNELSTVFEIRTAPAINGQTAPEVADNEPESKISEPIRDTKSKMVTETEVPETEVRTESRQLIVSELEISQQKTVTGKSVASETEGFAKKEATVPYASIQAEDSNPRLPASSKSAKDTKAGASVRLRQSDEIVTADYTPPLPENTLDSFNIYIEKNIRNPEEHSSGQTAVVTLTFRVRKTGKIDNIKIISSPGKPYSNEAIRVIQEGPHWIPARQNGENIEDTVTLNMTFR
jgi:TonB family protein